MNAAHIDTYDPQNAAALCQFAAEAYNPLPGGAGKGEGEPYLVIENETTDTLAIVVQNETDTVIAFRGTMDLRNWLTDVHVAFKADDGSKIHAGFFNALQSVNKQVVDAVFGPGYKSKRIWVTGHSLGGALATLFAWHCANAMNCQPFAGVYTFGQPRVGNAAFVDDYDFALKARTFRVVDSRDIVPHIPWLLRFYRHAGHEVFYSGPGPFIVDRPLLAYFLSDLAAAYFASRKLTSVESWIGDHYVNKYLKLFTVAAVPPPESNPVNN